MQQQRGSAQLALLRTDQEDGRICYPSHLVVGPNVLHRFPEEKLTRVQALKGMTYDAAHASFAEDRIGSLASGKKADFVILDKDIITIPQEEILQTRVVATVKANYHSVTEVSHFAIDYRRSSCVWFTSFMKPHIINQRKTNINPSRTPVYEQCQSSCEAP